jgi:hypothetical protein
MAIRLKNGYKNELPRNGVDVLSRIARALNENRYVSSDMTKFFPTLKKTVLGKHLRNSRFL